LGVNKKYLNQLNFTGDRWYDTYTIIIDLFLKTYSNYVEISEVQKLLNRKYLKIIIMTVNYNAGLLKCTDLLFDLISADGISNEEHLHIYKKFIIDLYLYLNTGLFKELYITDKGDFLEKNKEILKLIDATIDLKYFNLMDNKVVYKIKDLR
jgi:hypothetical protein